MVEVRMRNFLSWSRKSPNTHGCSTMWTKQNIGEPEKDDFQSPIEEGVNIGDEVAKAEGKELELKVAIDRSAVKRKTKKNKCAIMHGICVLGLFPSISDLCNYMFLHRDVDE